MTYSAKTPARRWLKRCAVLFGTIAIFLCANNQPAFADTLPGVLVAILNSPQKNYTCAYFQSSPSAAVVIKHIENGALSDPTEDLCPADYTTSADSLQLCPNGLRKSPCIVWSKTIVTNVTGPSLDSGATVSWLKAKFSATNENWIRDALFFGSWGALFLAVLILGWWRWRGSSQSAARQDHDAEKNSDAGGSTTAEGSGPPAAIGNPPPTQDPDTNAKPEPSNALPPGVTAPPGDGNLSQAGDEPVAEPDKSAEPAPQQTDEDRLRQESAQAAENVITKMQALVDTLQTVVGNLQIGLTPDRAVIYLLLTMAGDTLDMSVLPADTLKTSESGRDGSGGVDPPPLDRFLELLAEKLSRRLSAIVADAVERGKDGNTAAITSIGNDLAEIVRVLGQLSSKNPTVEEPEDNDKSQTQILPAAADAGAENMPAATTPVTPPSAPDSVEQTQVELSVSNNTPPESGEAEQPFSEQNYTEAVKALVESLYSGKKDVDTVLQEASKELADAGSNPLVSAVRWPGGVPAQQVLAKQVAALLITLPPDQFDNPKQAEAELNAFVATLLGGAAKVIYPQLRDNIEKGIHYRVRALGAAASTLIKTIHWVGLKCGDVVVLPAGVSN